MRSFLGFPLGECAVDVCRRCGLMKSQRQLSNEARASRRSFVANVTGLAVVAAVLALLPAVGMGADDAVAEPAVAAAADAGVTATGYRPNVMSNEQMVEKLWTGADTVWVLICAMLVFS